MYTAEGGGGGGGGTEDILKGGKFFNIPPHIIQNFWTTPILTEIKIDIPPPPGLDKGSKIWAI